MLLNHVSNANNKLLIELFEGLTGSESNDKEAQDFLVTRCLNASSQELKEFFDELLEFLCQYPDIYIPTLNTYLSYLYEHYSCNSMLSDFTSMLITIVMIENLNYSDNAEFRELFHLCVELLWKVSNNKTAIQTTKRVFDEILDTHGVFGIWISDKSGRHCIKRILFSFNMIKIIDRDKAIKAVDMVTFLVENCSDHNNDTSQLPEKLSEYKACTALLKTLTRYQNAERDALFDAKKNSFLPKLQDMIKLEKSDPEIRNLDEGYNTFKSVMTTKNLSLSIQDKQNFDILGMEAPRKLSELISFLRVLEERKINLFKVLIEFLPCESCHRQALVYFSPEKYSSLANENGSADIDYNSILSERRLPFEFSDNDKLGDWDVLLSEDAINDMRNLESPQMIKAVMKKFGHISSGKWDQYELRNKVADCSSVDVYEMELPDHKGLKILWQVDCRFSSRSCSLAQVVKIWTVTTSQEQIREMLENLRIVHQVYTMEHIQLCKTNKNQDGVILPKTFGSEKLKSTNDRLHDHQVDDERLIKVHQMLVTNKFIPLSKNLFKSIVLGGSGFTFQVSEDEYEIIRHPTSAIIIGRSGTGKTTCIVFRQIASYLMKSSQKLYKNPSLNTNVIEENIFNKRQIFITVSPTLCARVKQYFDRLRESAILAEKKMSFTQYYEYTKKKEEESINNNQSDNSMLEEDDEMKALGNIPNSFPQLTDEHFPLFITHEKFSQMLEGTYEIDVNKLWKTKQEFNTNNIDEDEEYNPKSTLVDTSEKSWAHFITFDLFVKKYWDRFSDYYRRKLDPALVYAEFSIIKGSNPKDGHLSREEYLSINTKRYPIFYDRDEIYNLFERYERMKTLNYDYDSIDRTRAILRCVKKKALGGPHIHEVYIDECQDNQIVDFSLIFKLFNRADGIFLAGDTAQCIARGSSFRFQSVFSLMYEWELDRSQNNPNWNGSLKPKRFELNTNYRSHNGILGIASSVIDLIQHFFPDSIDKLPRECGEVGGPRPLIFKGFQDKTSVFKCFSVSEKPGDIIEFGANQVIIVRNEEAKKRLEESIGKVGLILTIFEAKGMEFNDVLLYDFFTDSPAGQKWRLILSAIEGYSGGMQTLSYEKHYILSSELKHLYVAVTRAREHIWIFDRNPDLGEPIWKYWNHYGLVRTKNDGDPLPNLAKKSNLHEWNEMGKHFFERRQYEQAIFCFEKSENEEGRKLANAYLLRQVARDSILDSDNNTVKLNFIEAANSFKKCSRPIQAAACYQDIEMHKEAGDIYYQWDIFESAAECYVKCKEWQKAGECYEKAKKYADAVTAYKNGGYYNTVVDLMQRQKIDDKTFRRISRLVNIHYRRGNDKEMCEKALHIIPSQEERIELLADHAPEELLKVYEKNKQFRAAGEFLRSRGDLEKAALMFNRSANNKDIIESLVCVLYPCRMKILKNMKCMNLNTSEELCKFLRQANDIMKSKSSKALKESKEFKILEEEIQLYSAYLNNDLNRISKCIQAFQKYKATVSEFRAINIWLQTPKAKIQIVYWNERLQHLLRLCELAFLFIAPPNNNTTNIEKICKGMEAFFLIGEVDDRKSKRKIPSDSPLLDFINGAHYRSKDETHYKNNVGSSAEVMNDQHIYDINDVHQAISQFLASYIFELLEDADHAGRAIPDIDSKICYEFASSGKCFAAAYKHHKCQDSHIKPTPTFLYNHLLLICLQYSVMRKLLTLYHRRLLKEDQSISVRSRQRYWAEKLVDHLFRYQSPQTSCPEISYLVIRNNLNSIYGGFINLAHKVWLKYKFKNGTKVGVFKNGRDFGVMLKCMFVFQQLRDKLSIEKLYFELKGLRCNMKGPYDHNSFYDPLIGFEYDQQRRYDVSVGLHLSWFFFDLHSNNVVSAIYHAIVFIRYAIDHIHHVYLMKTPGSLDDFTSLIEFMTALIFTANPKTCDFCLPRSYLVNYFYAFNMRPLLPSQNNRNVYSASGYQNALRDSIDLFEQLLYKLDFTKNYHSPSILRLLRLLILIGWNEYVFTFKIGELFKKLSHSISNHSERVSEKIKKYLKERQNLQLAKILINDLSETDCDSLVVVYYKREGISRFADLEKHGAKILKYNSGEEFRSSLWKIVSPIAIEGKAAVEASFSCNEVKKDEQNEFSEDNPESAAEIQAWFQKIIDSPDSDDKAKKIQKWYRSILNRSRKYPRNKTLDKIYHKVYIDITKFCNDLSHWETAIKLKGKKVVRKYIMLLKGYAVDSIVKLDKMQNEMDIIKNKFKKIIQSKTSDDETLESCINLEDDLKSTHYGDVKGALESLSTTENAAQHKEADIEWLETELQKTNDIIYNVSDWIDECKAII
ncbi:6929_t:CDS:10 [Cetraspora pellucida]|uniref:6929_t:CDS:1 n=1 Tax=Cetraspora pellucida TaxID=1433469 RepID=A0A9N9B735_9GLOM|nr:6929_t:CDS:10 [Cetraspora pellucida]